MKRKGILHQSMNEKSLTIVQYVIKLLICCSNFAFNAGLRIHIAAVYEGKRPNECIICDAKFTRKADLKIHIDAVHEKKKKTYMCNDCNTRFARKADMQMPFS